MDLTFDKKKTEENIIDSARRATPVVRSTGTSSNVLYSSTSSIPDCEKIN